MARITIDNISKAFGKVKALDGVSLDVKDKEFFVLFGPAGAGKTTILNCIAGIAMPEEGTVSFDGRIMNLVDTANRNVAMVFENYALYPQMTVYDNMASPLRSKLYRQSEDVIKERVHAAAKMMKMEGLLERLPSQLSNGQKQRVAMGRALVRTPNVFLMDEPLAHLDAKLRNAMRTELKEMQANFGTTSIYVTHDFMEAMSLGDRIAIVNKGKIVQVGTPDEIYYLACNEFVAQLMGDPEINLLDCALEKDGEGYCAVWKEAPDHPLRLPANAELFQRFDKEAAGKGVHMGIRPQNAHYFFEPTDGAIKGTVYSFETIGNKSVLTANIGGTHLRMIAPNGLSVKLDQDVYVTFDIDRAIFFDAGTTEYIGRFDEAAIRELAASQAKEA